MRRPSTDCCFYVNAFWGIIALLFCCCCFSDDELFLIFIPFFLVLVGGGGLFQLWTPFICGISETGKLCNQSAVIMSLYQYVTAWRNLIFTHPGFYGKSLMMLIGFMTDTDGEFRCPNLSL